MRQNLKAGVTRVRKIYPGILASAIVAMAAMFLADHYMAPVMLFALLLGMAFAFLYAENGRSAPGIDLSARLVLQIGVALLGVRLSFEQIAEFGPTPVILVIASVVTTIGFGVIVGRLLGQRGQFGLISGGSVAICGASAALAIASVLPRSKRLEEDTILVVIGVTTLSTIAMVLYPIGVALLGFDDIHAGYFIGSTIHDVAQVVGAGYSISEQAGNVSTYTKLLRVAMLLPMVLAITIALHALSSRSGKASVPVPWFLLVFALLVGANSVGWIGPELRATMSSTSQWCLVTAISALGMKTSLRDMLNVGFRPIALIIIETLFIGGLVLFLIRVLV